MKEKSYEEKIADIKEYLKQKEEEVNNNKVSERIVKPVSYEQVNKEENVKDELESLNFEEFLKFDEKNVDGEKNTIEEKKETSKSKTIVEKKKKSKISLFLIILLLITPIFISLSVISMRTTYLVREPFNYIMYAVSGISLIAIICLSLLKIVNDKPKIKLKYIITVLVIIVLDILFTIFAISINIWKHIDPILEHKKLFLGIILFIILLIIAIIIICKIKKVRIKKNIKNMLLTIFMSLYVLCYIDGLIILYGPNKDFMEWLVPTAMQTMNHQYFCRWFYSDKDIEYVQSQNYVLESGESTDPDLIKVEEKEEVIVYENEYEEAVLKKDNKNDLYKIIDLEVNGCSGHLAVIYDPKMVHVAVTPNVGGSGQYVTTMAKNSNALLAINGGGFYDPGNSSPGGTPTGITISNGKIITNNEYGTNVQGGGIIGFDGDGKFYLLKNTTAQQAIEMGITDAVSWGPFLIVNGTPSFIKGSGGWGYAARTAIGQRADGIVLLLVIYSNATRTKGADMVDLTEIMQNYGAINAANLDGGTSSVMVLPQDKALKYRSDCDTDYCYINDPIDGGLSHATRAIADSIVVVDYNN